MSEETVSVGVPPGVIVSFASWEPLTVPAKRLAVVVVDADCVVMLIVALLLPAGMMMLAGTDAAGVLLVNVTAVPPEGAGAFSVTVPWDVLPPVALAGLSVNELMAIVAGGGVRVSAACWERLPTVAVMVTVVFAATGCVGMANEVVVLPSGMATLGGTAARLLLLESVTTTVPGAGPVRFNIPWELRPPVTLDALPFDTDTPGWLRPKEESITEPAGVSASVVCRELPFRLAVMVAVVLALTWLVVIVKLVRM